MARPSSISDEQLDKHLVIAGSLDLPRLLVTEVYSLVVVGIVPGTKQVEVLLLN